MFAVSPNLASLAIEEVGIGSGTLALFHHARAHELVPGHVIASMMIVRQTPVCVPRTTNKLIHLRPSYDRPDKLLIKLRIIQHHCSVAVYPVVRKLPVDLLALPAAVADHEARTPAELPLEHLAGFVMFSVLTKLFRADFETNCSTTSFQNKSAPKTS